MKNFQQNSGLEPDCYLDGKVDGVFFGRPWINHPDLAKRLKYGKPWDNELDLDTVYGKYYVGEDEQKHGYLDYPTAQYQRSVCV